MDNFESGAQNSLSNGAEQPRNAASPVATLLSALLDDITVHTAAAPQPNQSARQLPTAPLTALKETIAPTSRTNGEKAHENSFPTPNQNQADNGAAIVEPKVPAMLPPVSAPPSPQVAEVASEPPADLRMTNGQPLLSQALLSQPQLSNNSSPTDNTWQPDRAVLAEANQPTAATDPQFAPEPNAEPYQGDGMAINIKGRADGVIIEIGRGNWEILNEALRKRLNQAGGFFRGGNVALDLAERSLQESDLRLICDVLVAHGMKPALIRTSPDRTFQSALMLGLAGTLESNEGRPLETVNAAPSNQESQTHYVYRGALRSGQVLKRRSHILIIGDVNPGSEVIATGDILIWGRLRGIAHAGVEGDVRAMVAAFDIDPVQLRIADAVAMGNSGQSEGGYRWVWSRNTEKRPEVARLVNGQISIEPWDEAKTGGAPVLKKRR